MQKWRKRNSNESAHLARQNSPHQELMAKKEINEFNDPNYRDKDEEGNKIFHNMTSSPLHHRLIKELGALHIFPKSVRKRQFI